MSSTTVLGLAPGHEPVHLLELSNASGWGSSIWNRIAGGGWLNDLAVLCEWFDRIETLPLWQQIPLLLTADTGVVPAEYAIEAADALDEFDRRCPAPAGHVNHVPTAAALLREQPEVPYIGVWVTSVSCNPFWTYDEELGESIPTPEDEWHMLERHRASTTYQPLPGGDA